MERRLAAILAADMMGYSRLMAADEAGTFARQKAQRKELIDPKIREYGGRVVKSTGDGVLVEFPSVVDALRCAVTIQLAMPDREAAVPKENRIAYRIGINLGDIIIEDDDIYGDGVNVAARLETLAEPGGICVSRTVVNHVKGKVASDFDDQGEQEVKNIPEPVHVFRVLMEPEAASELTAGTKRGSWRRRTAAAAAAAVLVIAVIGTMVWQPWAPRVEPASVAAMALPLPDKPSIAVLPFDNMSADPEQAYFADGMTDDLITGLSKLSGLFVISRNSTFTYKGKPVKVRQVAEELGVRYVLEGSVRRSGDQVRVNAQLIDAFTGYHLWAEKYDGQMTDVFGLQDEVVGSIVSALAVNLGDDDAVTHTSKDTESPEAYDAYLQGKELFRVRDPENTAKAISFFNKAVELDPEFHRAHAALATAYWRVFSRSWVERAGLSASTTDAFDTTKKFLALALKKPTAEAYETSAEILLWDSQYQAALRDINEAITLDPNEADSYITKSWILIRSGHAREAEENALLAMRLNPSYPATYLQTLGEALFHQDRFEEAADVLERVVQREPEYEYTYRYLAASYGHLGRLEEAKSAIREFEELRAGSDGGPLTVQSVGDFTPFADENYRASLQEGLRKAGVPDGAAPQLSEGDYKSLVTKSGGEFTVEGARTIDLAEAKSLQEEGALFIDVRSETGYLKGHIPGAIGLDLKTQLTKESLAEVAEKDQKIVFYCDGIYCYKSADACAKALTWGYTDVLYFAGGEPAWSKAGYPIAKK